MSRAARAALVAITALGVAPSCGPVPSAPAAGGDPERGQLLLRQYGCSGCHDIPGVATAKGNVGPPLADVGRRVYLAGVIPNTPENMVRWIRAPQEIAPRTVMPNLQVTEPHARDMVAFLYRAP